ncbi:hypothetical protein EJV47_26575 [Hymenobacter gummosus]|uniref:Uncharacterized protein n=1 Tax=Hymenobacter gummosus TaxID=1776032 RepID=A0A3S0QDX0_9BACT|nr:hypothetical protein [Hymenobacter gummosus]RTQ44938.1 hypothetical protein EJV47_26575 [Hymenobacter gummosus]
MRQYLLLGLLLFSSTLVAGQQSKGPNFDIKDFNEKFEVAQWLTAYDRVAWVTTDSVMLPKNESRRQQLGGQWFCYQDAQNGWHALYGKYEKGRFEPAFHYVINQAGSALESANRPDSALVNPYARALLNARRRLDEVKGPAKLNFNHYIRRNTDKTLTIWFLPAFQTDNTAVYGGEFCYTLSRTGCQLLNKDEYFQGQFRGFKVDRPREIWLNYIDVEKPTLGSIFFVWYYKSYFTQIFIDNKTSKSTVFKNEQGYYWVHAEKPPK